MSPSAVLHAGRRERQSGVAVVVTATGFHARCSPPHAPSAAKTRKCLFSLPMASLSIAAIATEKSDQVDNAGLTANVHGPGKPGPCLFTECANFATIEGGQAPNDKKGDLIILTIGVMM